MTETKYYTIEQLAELSKIPSTTARYYIKGYKQFFDYTRPEGAIYRLYSEKSVDILKEIRKHQKAKLQKHDIIEKLEQKFVPIYDIEAEAPKKVKTKSKQHRNGAIVNSEATQQQTKLALPQVAEQIDFLHKLNVGQIKITKRYEGQNKELQKTIDELDQALIQKEQELKDKDQLINKLQSTIDSKKTDIDGLKTKLLKLENDYKELKKKKRLFFNY